VVYAVLLHPKAAKELERIEAPARFRIKERLRDLKDNPEKAGKVLKPSDFYSLRIGDYHALYELDRDKNQVIVLFIGHRKKVYDDFSRML
jgi:mRNA interferase RelE/StbE